MEDQPEDMDMDMEGMYDDSDEGEKLFNWFSSSFYCQSFHSYIIITFIFEVKQSLFTFQMQWVILINGRFEKQFEYLVISAPELVGDSEDDSEDDEDSSALVKCMNIF